MVQVSSIPGREEKKIQRVAWFADLNQFPHASSFHLDQLSTRGRQGDVRIRQPTAFFDVRHREDYLKRNREVWVKRIA